MTMQRAEVATPAVKRQGSRLLRDESLWALLFLGPNLVLFLIFTAFPIVFGFALSFVRWNVLEPWTFVGLANYQRFFTGDPLAGKVIVNTLYLTLGVLPPSMALALLFAVLLNQKIRGLAFWRGIYYLPMVTSAVAIGVVWKWVFSRQFGLLNAFLGLFGVTPQDWLFNQALVMPALILVSIWTSLPLKIIFYLAALQGVSPEYYEAASIDGAGGWQQFRHITWPLITPTTFFLIIISVIGLLTGSFDLIWTMTQGGPLDASNVITIHLYRTAFIYFDMGYASAMAYLLFLIVLAVTIVQWISQKRWVHY
jgi:multiple sugar transport system permease protein